MFLLRGTVATLAAFFLAYAVLSGILVCVWRMAEKRQAIRSAAALFAMRIFPLAGSTLLAALFTLPAYLYLEPYFLDEKIGAGAFALAAAGTLVLLAGFFRSASAWRRTSHWMMTCLARSRRMKTISGICAHEVRDANPVMFVTGVWRPKLLVSSGAVALLDVEEMQAAIRHEKAHVTRGDNLKKLLLQFCALPGLTSLEHEWMKATEEAADDAAAGNEGAALLLASALIKMARASSRTTTPELSTALVPSNSACVSARVERLLAERRSAFPKQRFFWWCALASSALVVGMNYAWALQQMHELTELLIR